MTGARHSPGPVRIPLVTRTAQVSAAARMGQGIEVEATICSSFALSRTFVPGESVLVGDPPFGTEHEPSPCVSTVIASPGARHRTVDGGLAELQLRWPADLIVFYRDPWRQG